MQARENLNWKAIRSETMTKLAGKFNTAEGAFSCAIGNNKANHSTRQQEINSLFNTFTALRTTLNKELQKEFKDDVEPNIVDENRILKALASRLMELDKQVEHLVEQVKQENQQYLLPEPSINAFNAMSTPSLTEAQQKYAEQVQQMTAEIHALTEKNQALDTQLKCLQDEMLALTQEKNRDNHQLVAKLQQAEADAQKAEQESADKLQQARDNIVSLTQKNEELTNQVQTLQRERLTLTRAKDEENQQLVAKLQQAEAEVRNAVQGAQEQKKLCENISDDLLRMNSENERLRRELNATNKINFQSEDKSVLQPPIKNADEIQRLQADSKQAIKKFLQDLKKNIEDTSFDLGFFGGEKLAEKQGKVPKTIKKIHAEISSIINDHANNDNADALIKTLISVASLAMIGSTKSGGFFNRRQNSTIMFNESVTMGARNALSLQPRESKHHR